MWLDRFILRQYKGENMTWTSNLITCVFFIIVIIIMYSLHKKVKQSLYSSGQALRFPKVSGSQFSRQSAHEGGKDVSPTHRPPLPPKETFLVLRGWANPRTIVRSEGLSLWEIPVTPSGIEPATFHLVAQCLNQLRHRVHYLLYSMLVNKY